MTEIELPQEVMDDFPGKIRLIDRDAGEFTVAQLAEYMGFTIDTARRKLRARIQAGEYAQGKRILENGSISLVYWRVNKVE